MASFPTTVVEHEGVEYEVPYRPVLECQNDDCEDIRGAEIPSENRMCPKCGQSDRVVKGKYYHTQLDKAILTGEEKNSAEVESMLRGFANLIEALEANGWSLDGTTQSGHIVMSTGDVPPQEIIA